MTGRIAASIYLLATLLACSNGRDITAIEQDTDGAATASDSYQPTAAGAPSTDIFVAHLDLRADAAQLSQLVNITDRAGYDNQPFFNADGRSVLYTSARADQQTDILLYHLPSGRTRALTNTPSSEFSPTLMPGEDRFSAVHEDAQSLQLWHFNFDGTDLGGLLNHIQPVGYHAWADANTLALAINNEEGPPSLHMADLRSGQTRLIAEGISRSLHKIPNQAAISFAQQAGDSERWIIQSLDLASGQTQVLAVGQAGSQDYAWSPDGDIIMGSGSKLYRWSAPGPWREIADLAPAVRDISRIAINRQGDRIAIVGHRASQP